MTCRNCFISCVRDDDHETSVEFPLMEQTMKHTKKNPMHCYQCCHVSVCYFLFFSLVWSFLRKPRGISISRSVFLWALWPSMTFGIFGMFKNRMDFLFIAANKQFSLKGIPSPHPIPKNNWLTHSGCLPRCVFSFEVVQIKSVDSTLCNGDTQ